MKTILGNLHKMHVTHAQPIEYCLHLGDQQILLNDYLNKTLSLTFTGNIHCIHCGRKTSKSFQQGFCFPCLRRLQECNLCIIHPERCLVETGKCPQDDWAHSQCHQPHVIYLANASALKIGITRDKNIPSRWIDQGAIQALPIFKTSNRLQAGKVEVAFKNFVADKTNWRAMLKNQTMPLDLLKERDRLIKTAAAELQPLLASYPDDIHAYETNEIVTLEYPVLQYPQKIVSYSLDKNPQLTDKLIGIKGQYLIFAGGVINIRKFGGYEVEFAL